MKIVIFGIGYVGLTSAACLIKDGHHVIGIDVSASKVADVNAGRSPIFEPGLEELLTQGIKEGRLSASQEIGDRLVDADVAIVCVGTPSAADGSHNMGYIAEVSRQIATAMTSVERAQGPLTVMYRSTMRPGHVSRRQVRDEKGVGSSPTPSRPYRIGWYHRPGSNGGPLDPQSSALTN